MKTKAFALLLLLAPSAALAEHTRVTYPGALSVEMFGRGMMYSIGFDRVVNDDIAAGVAFGTAGTNTLSGVDAGLAATMLPVYVNYYFTRDQGSIYATAAATLVTNNSSVQGLKSQLGGLEYSSSPLLPSIGAGYENRGDNGFLFRLTGYALLGANALPWIGFTFGYAF